MRKTALPEREAQIGQRLREARETFLTFTQGACAKQIGIERSRWANYEMGRAPLRQEVALRICHQFIISEEWLATGRFEAMRAAAVFNETDIGDATDLATIFKRQSMDLLTEAICQRIPPGELFSAAYDSVLAPVYKELCKTFFHVPRVVFSPFDPPERSENITRAYLERWLKLLSNQALAAHKDQTEVRFNFTRSLLNAGNKLFSEYLAANLDPPKTTAPIRASVISHSVSAAQRRVRRLRAQHRKRGAAKSKVPAFGGG